MYDQFDGVHSGVGGVYVQFWYVSGVPPVHPLGDPTVLVGICFPLELQSPQVYVNELQVCVGGVYVQLIISVVV